MSREAMKLALEALEHVIYWDNEKPEWEYAHAAITALRKALAEQPAQQEPIDKNGSPCPEFWDWLSKAYNFEGLGNFTKYNMEVAFLAGKQNTSPPAQRKPLTVDEVWQNDQLMSINAELGCGMDLLMEVVNAIEAAHGIKENT